MSPGRFPQRKPCLGGAWQLAGLLLLVLMTPAVPAASDTDPYEPLRSEDLANAQRLQALAEAGDVRAAFMLGGLLSSGRAGMRDDSEALRWFRVAASAGLPVAQYNMALMLSAGRGAERDYAEALRWYEAAGEQGMAEAGFNAAMLLLNGAPGVPREQTRGVDWLRRAADRGLAQAEYNLGVLREFGRGMPRDLNAAGAWYRRASRQGYQPAVERLARLEGEATAPAVPTSTASVLTPASQGGTARIDGAPAPATSSPVGTAAVAGGAQVNAWVLARDPAHFTLQLFSRRDEEGAREFLASHDIGDRGGYFRVVNDGQRWFSMVYGDFDSHAAAEKAGAQLPRRFKVSKPWIRNFGAIQKLIER